MRALSRYYELAVLLVGSYARNSCRIFRNSKPKGQADRLNQAEPGPRQGHFLGANAKPNAATRATTAQGLILEAYACLMNAMSRAVETAEGGLEYLLPDTLLSAAYLMVAGSIHLRLDACPSAQLKVLAST